jgi:kynurenine formamidase
MHNLPQYDELPAGKSGGRLGWNAFGSADNVGLLNLMTPEVVVNAARVIKSGEVFPLNAPVDLFAPALTHTRGVPRHVRSVRHLDALTGMDDVYDNFYPQASSQWDALCHASYALDVFYNGLSSAAIRDEGRIDISHWARRGIAGRAVVLDMTNAPDYSPAERIEFTVDDLESTLARHQIVRADGDILMIHTGFTAWYKAADPDVRAKLAGSLQTPGLQQSEDMCRYLWDSRFAAVVSDNLAVEAWPANFSAEVAPFGMMHQMLIGSFGMALGELWWLDDLVKSCQADGRYEAFVVSAPIHKTGGSGSPANAIAIK